MNGYGSVLLNTTTTLVHGGGRALEIPATKSARFNQRTRNTNILSVI